MTLIRTLLLTPLVGLLLASCAPQDPLPIQVHPGMTVDQALAACRDARVDVHGPTASGPKSHTLETYELSDGRKLNLVTDRTKTPPLVLEASVTPSL